jgi:hypothetical protein
LYYADKKEKIYFSNESKMNLLVLKKELISLNIPKESYCLTKEIRDKSFCILKNRNKWEVFYAEDGSRLDVKIFDDENSACEYLLLVLKNKYKI